MGAPIRTLVVVGTRPEAIKLAPVIRRLRADHRFALTVCATGQHRGLLDDALAAFGIKPDIDLDLMTPDQRPAVLAARVLQALDGLLAQRRFDWMLVQGDTVTTLAAAEAAFYARVPLAHVEAGLRSGDLRQPFPEEGQRAMVARIADLHFAPTEEARGNLLAEGVDWRRIHVTGNTGIDALLTMAEAVRGSDACDRDDVDGALRQERGPDTRRLLLVTAHRRENLGDGLARICVRRCTQLAERTDIEIVWPLHPNPAVGKAVPPLLGAHPRIRLIAPPDYRAFVRLLLEAEIVLTDSGGLQEEAPALGRPVLVLRDVTERPEAVAAGAARLVGTDPDRILGEAMRLLDDPAAYAAMARPRLIFGDGNAAERIVKVLAKVTEGRDRLTK
ncbi:MAG: UDP-N-acetylglucosamine 2-epimerase [Rhodothalassiaceae bacterium]|nr:MAG: UDP-N-acetylglucosamine 2-epimerase [Rhodothalassiaceae bacterium]